MKITDQHKLSTEEGDSFSLELKDTPNIYNPPFFNTPDQQPDSIIIHYTAMTSAERAAEVLCNPRVKASAHLVVGKKGEIWQLAPFNYRTWHAGRSEYNGRKYYNKYSIGIEIDNAGWLQEMGGGYSRPELLRHGVKFSEDEIIKARHKNPSVRYRFWQKYTDEQLVQVFKLCELLAEKYPIKEILGHDEISPRRKQDPGPAFPIDELRNTVLNEGRFQEDDKDLELSSKGEVNISKLNIRDAPQGELAGMPLTRGTKLQIHEEKDGWYRVTTNLEGWVSAKYVERK